MGIEHGLEVVILDQKLTVALEHLHLTKTSYKNTLQRLVANWIYDLRQRDAFAVPSCVRRYLKSATNSSEFNRNKYVIKISHSSFGLIPRGTNHKKNKYRPSLTKLTGTDQMYNAIMRSPTIWLRTSLQNWRFMLQATQTWTYGTILNTERPIRRQNPQRLRQLLRQSDQIRLTRGHLHNSARAILEKARRVLVMISLCSQREFFWWWRRNSCGSEDGQSA